MKHPFLHGLVAVAALGLAACTTPVQKPTNPRQVRIPPPQASVIKPERSPEEEEEEERFNTPAPRSEKDGPPDPREIPLDLAALPDPVPVHEPLSPGGNPKSYEVFGKRYNVLNSATGFRETGLASWYGKKFHGRRTSNGERYDMFKLTAAHKHLPLPTYVRVTNLGNGKSVVVRVNDRGPFHGSRIIDLSFAAATRLDTVGKIATVEVEAITPGQELPPPPRLRGHETAIARATPARTTGRLLQIGAFTDPVNAVAMREEIEQLGIDRVVVRVGLLDNGDTIHRVMLGPFDERQRMDEARIRLRTAGYDPINIAQ
ncbi:septal ring lytic transglycosylase RlpA family protein [Panacagrimonas sp.]|uniref:septal ring lytic transglycosylase RlpA family protein n=1 Tax=Panacagrimonas sp. TaxID=2480088 RepID=UPI003B51A9A3